MDGKFFLTQGAGHKLEGAVRRAGGTAADIEALSSGNTFAQIIPLLRGMGEVTGGQRFIDCSAKPFPYMPGELHVIRHDKQPMLCMPGDETCLNLYRDPRQVLGERVLSHELLNGAKREDRQPLNANVLDFLLTYTGFIPAEWKQFCVVFPGTRYWNDEQQEAVRCLRWEHDHWRPDVVWCDDHRWSSDVAIAYRG